mgnify:CR=1 FL=1
MKQTSKYKLNMPELSDGLSVAALNENMQKVDALLCGLSKMASGSYTGTGSMSVTIETPEMRPAALLVRACAQLTPTMTLKKKEDIIFNDVKLESSGFVLWNGNNIAKKCWRKEGEVYDPVTEEVVSGYREYLGEIVFTPTDGSLSWTLNKTPASEVDHSGLINNKSGIVYEWIALGSAEA